MSYYADTDFFLALIKPNDWLKTGAEEIYKKYKGKIVTSYITLVEILIIAKRINLDPEIVIEAVFEISMVEDLTKPEAITAAHLIKHENMTIFDAFHAVLSKNKPIISSDSTYDKIGLERIKLRA